MNHPKEWHDRRAKMIGGSELGTILGLNPWKTPLQYWGEKTGTIEPFKGNRATKIGQLLESFVADEYAAETGRICTVEPYYFTSGIFGGNIDRVSTDKEGNDQRILEIKTASMRSDEWGEPGTDKVPMIYLMQCLHYMHITGIHKCDLCVIFLTTKELAIYHIPYDEALIERAWENATRWWNAHIVENVPPPPSCKDDIKLLFPEATKGEVKETTIEVNSVAILLHNLKKKRDEFDKAIEEAENNIKEAMGTAEVLTYNGDVVATWTNNKPSTKVDYKSIVEAINPPAEIIESNTKKVPGARVFRLKVNVNKN